MNADYCFRKLGREEKRLAGEKKHARRFIMPLQLDPIEF